MKSIYIYRNVDLINVAFGDKILYGNKKKAIEEIRALQKSDTYTDILFKVDFKNEEEYDEFMLSEDRDELTFDLISEKGYDVNVEVVYKR